MQTWVQYHNTRVWGGNWGSQACFGHQESQERVHPRHSSVQLSVVKLGMGKQISAARLTQCSQKYQWKNPIWSSVLWYPCQTHSWLKRLHYVILGLFSSFQGMFPRTVIHFCLLYLARVVWKCKPRLYHTSDLCFCSPESTSEWQIQTVVTEVLLELVPPELRECQWPQIYSQDFRVPFLGILDQA